MPTSTSEIPTDIAGLWRVAFNDLPDHTSVIDSRGEVVILHDRVEGVRWLLRAEVDNALRIHGGTIYSWDGRELCTVTRGRSGKVRATAPDGRVVARCDTLYGCVTKVARVHLKRSSGGRKR